MFALYLFNIPIKLVNSFLALLTPPTILCLASEFNFTLSICSTILSIALGLIDLEISPSKSASFNFSKKISLSFLVDLFKVDCTSGNTESTSLVIVFTIFFAVSVSPAFKPCLTISASNTSCGKSPLGLNGAPMYLFTHLSNALSLYANSFPLCAKPLAALPIP